MKSNISKVSTNKLIEELNRRISFKAKELDALRSEIESAFSSSHVNTERKQKGLMRIRKIKSKASGANKNSQSLPNAIAEVLSNQPNGLSIKEIQSELEKSDWQTSSANKYNLIGVALASNKKKFEKISRGTYRLKIQEENA